MGTLAVDALLDGFSGNKPENLVNENIWQTRRK